MYILKRILPVLIVLGVAAYLIYNSKRSDYKNDLLFFDADINAHILKIVESRGTKVYYSEKDFFYMESYGGIGLMEGDSIAKEGRKISVYRKNKKNNYYFIGKGYPLKSTSSYFKYFFF